MKNNPINPNWKLEKASMYSGFLLPRITAQFEDIDDFFKRWKYMKGGHKNVLKGIKKNQHSNVILYCLRPHRRFFLE